MYVHLGGDLSISDRWIVAILDLDELNRSAVDDLRFWREAEAAERVEILSDSIPLSLVLTLDKIYLSPLPAKTLSLRLKRAQARMKSRNT
ncbi:MAG: DUF370 domain-containing protein [Eubacteriales bacterium]|nr:DUF370 domain-containing protein [Eubacteriales bacterium]